MNDSKAKIFLHLFYSSKVENVNIWLSRIIRKILRSDAEINGYQVYVTKGYARVESKGRFDQKSITIVGVYINTFPVLFIVVSTEYTIFANIFICTFQKPAAGFPLVLLQAYTSWLTPYAYNSDEKRNLIIFQPNKSSA